MNQENNNENFEQPIQEEQVQPQPEPVQEPKEEKPVKTYTALLVVFMVISLLLAGFIIYEKAFKKEEKPAYSCAPTTCEAPTTEVAETCTPVEEPAPSESGSGLTIDNIKVVEFFDAKSKLKIPQINGTTPVILALNKEILKAALSNIEDWKSLAVMNLVVEGQNPTSNDDDPEAPDYIEEYNSCYQNVTSSYEARKKNGILIISIWANSESADDTGCWNASGPFYNYSDSFFFYDVANDKKLNIGEAAKALNAKLENDLAESTSKKCKSYDDLRTTNNGVELEFDEKGNLTITCTDYI